MDGGQAEAGFPAAPIGRAFAYAAAREIGLTT
jgi:hypothetical protein